MRLRRRQFHHPLLSAGCFKKTMLTPSGAYSGVPVMAEGDPAPGHAEPAEGKCLPILWDVSDDQTTNAKQSAIQQDLAAVARWEPISANHSPKKDPALWVKWWELVLIGWPRCHAQRAGTDLRYQSGWRGVVTQKILITERQHKSLWARRRQPKLLYPGRPKLRSTSKCLLRDRCCHRDVGCCLNGKSTEKG